MSKDTLFLVVEGRVGETKVNTRREGRKSIVGQRRANDGVCRDEQTGFLRVIKKGRPTRPLLGNFHDSRIMETVSRPSDYFVGSFWARSACSRLRSRIPLAHTSAFSTTGSYNSTSRYWSSHSSISDGRNRSLVPSLIHGIGVTPGVHPLRLDRIQRTDLWIPSESSLMSRRW